MSWLRSGSIQDGLDSEIKADIEAMVKLVRRVDRKKKILDLGQRRALAKEECLVHQLESEGEESARTVADISYQEAFASPSGDVLALEEIQRLLSNVSSDPLGR